ncbi:RNA-directed DNA polymerase, eukaryota [Tanacetum coccineum]|uniref:RNA-directed DNA polymerase, eukaryota n=1 Tax=Tanacetum coccineum TaxID=301880 RepID=A0ABQ5D9J5_9ASTR
MLWDYLGHVIDSWKGKVIIMGDFNVVRYKNERFGSNFNVQGATAFNSFIVNADLEEVPLGGCAFTWCHKSASKMSKLDRFLISESLLSVYLNFSAITLDRFLSNHRPILLRESTYDYGPIPFWFFRYWLEVDGFKKLVIDVWHDTSADGPNDMLNLMNKLKNLKKKIRVWNGNASDDIIYKRLEIVKPIQELDKQQSMEMAQKAKIKWAIEGDKNSKYYHRVLNKKRNHLSIRGVLEASIWIKNPNLVKNEFLTHLKNRFKRPKKVRPVLIMDFPRQLNSMQQMDMKAEVLNEEIKKTSVIEKDVVAAVKYFFQFGSIPNGCNSSFIALIPKVPDAKMVKDFRPISLIGSLYKIIAKILANRLVMVLGDLVNEVQSAFVADRQILDGPFILNEIFQWCKSKKKNSFIFKIDFEKAYDSIQWDYLDDVLKKFGFRERWCGWIRECLRSSWGSVIVNGSPTKEFQFFKGLKQGDPLSLFLFILIIESLHLSFQKLVDAGMFKGIALDSSMILSHMFYADDVVFVGQWSNSNIDTIIYALKCFERASGLSSSMSKIKIMGIAVNEEKVEQVAHRIGCGILNVPFTYLGSKVGGVPLCVLHRMESILCQFFNGADLDSKKAVWVKWNKVLSSKEKGSLGVSSLYALNRALLFKWVWQFTTQKSSLWARVITAIHGVDGKIGHRSKSGHKSIWRDIVQDMEVVKNQGTGLFSFMQKKLEPRSGMEASQLVDLLAQMEEVALGDMTNRWYWSLEGSGDFSVASVRKLIDDIRLPEVSSQTRWIKAVPIKVNVLA